jgi:hypothetical protein
VIAAHKCAKEAALAARRREQPGFGREDIINGQQYAILMFGHIQAVAQHQGELTYVSVLPTKKPNATDPHDGMHAKPFALLE